MPTSSETPEERLTAANRATFRKHHRNTVDRGISDSEGSALFVGPAGPGSPGLLADLQANAVQYASEAHRPRKNPGA